MPELHDQQQTLHSLILKNSLYGTYRIYSKDPQTTFGKHNLDDKSTFSPLNPNHINVELPNHQHSIFLDDDYDDNC